PLAIAHERQLLSSAPLSPQVFLPISTHFTATPGIPRTSPTLQHHSFACRLRVKLGDFTGDLWHRLRALYAQKSRTPLQPRYLPSRLPKSNPWLLPPVPPLPSW